MKLLQSVALLTACLALCGCTAASRGTSQNAVQSASQSASSAAPDTRLVKTFSGTVEQVSMHTLAVRAPEGTLAEFHPDAATAYEPDGTLYEGDGVEVDYRGEAADDAACTVVCIRRKARAQSAVSVPQDVQYLVGTLADVTQTSFSIVQDSGKKLVFARTKDLVVGMEGGMAEGAFVTLAYTGTLPEEGQADGCTVYSLNG